MRVITATRSRRNEVVSAILDARIEGRSLEQLKEFILDKGRLWRLHHRKRRRSRKSKQSPHLLASISGTWKTNETMTCGARCLNCVKIASCAPESCQLMCSLTSCLAILCVSAFSILNDKIS